MKNIGFLVAMAATTALATSAGAVTLALDDFNTPFSPNPLVTDGATVTSMAMVTAGANTFQRTTTLTADRNLNGPPSQASVRTDGGNAIFSNDTGVSSILTFSYDVGSVFFDAQTGAASGMLRLNEIFADRPRTYSFAINGVTQDIDEQLVDTEVGFPRDIMLAFDTSALTGSDIFTVTIDAGVEGVSFGDALDLEVSILDVTIPDLDVPAPAALGLFGLGLAGMGFARRRKA